MTLSDALQALDSGDWHQAHRIAQALDSREAAWFHGILHLLEGDEGNAQYWYRRAARPYPGRAAVEDELKQFKASLGH